MRSSTVCVPQTSMSRTVRPMRAAAASISATRAEASSRSSLIRGRLPRKLGERAEEGQPLLGVRKGEGLDGVARVDDHVVSRLRVLQQGHVDLHRDLSLGHDRALFPDQLLDPHRRCKTHRRVPQLSANQA